jgi:hypothetical protein
VGRYDYRIDFAYTDDDGGRAVGHWWLPRDPDPISWDEIRRLRTSLQFGLRHEDVTVWSVTLVRKRVAS